MGFTSKVFFALMGKIFEINLWCEDCGGISGGTVMDWDTKGLEIRVECDKKF